MFKKLFKKGSKPISHQAYVPTVEFINLNTRARTTSGTTALVWINRGNEVKAIVKK